MAMTSSDISVKRPRIDYSGNQWIQLTAACVPFNEASPGVVMNPQDLSNLNTSPQQTSWVKIHDTVFRVNCDPTFPVGNIGLSQYDFEKLHIRDYSPQILLRLHHSGNGNKVMAHSIGLKVRHIPNDISLTEIKAYTAAHLLSKISSAIYGHFFTESQEFCFPCATGVLVFKVDSIRLRGDTSTYYNTFKPRAFACVNENTNITFTTPPFARIQILSEYTVQHDANFHFKIKSFEKTPPNEYGNPILLHEDLLAHLVLLDHNRNYLHTKKTLRITHLPFGAINLAVSSISSPSRNDINDCFVKFDTASRMTFGCSAAKARIVTGEAVIPDAVKITVLSAMVFSAEGKFIKPKWIVVDDLIRALKGVPVGFVKDQSWSFPIPGGSAMIKIDSIYKDDEEMDLSRHYTLNDETDVEFSCDPSLSVPLVDTSQPYPLRSIKFDVSAPVWVKNVSMNYLVVSKAIEKIGKTQFARDQKETFLIPLKSYKFSLKVGATSFDPKVVSLGEVRYGLVGELTPETHIEIASGSDNLSMPKKTNAEILADPSGYLKELGIGGVSKKCLDYLVNVVLANGVARHDLSDLKVKPPRGILLYGPPGTGKTTLARVIGDFLGIPGSRVTHVDAPNLLNKWRGETERKIKELFSDARKSSEAQGPNAPVHLIIIDEIDALAINRKEDSSHHTVVNALLSGLSGLNTAANFFVIGTTNKLELIDDAIKRPGRLYPHIAIGVPDFAGRKQIFEIHTMQLRADGLLADDVTSDALAKATEDYTGAEIEGLIQQIIGEALPMAYAKDDKGAEVFSVGSIKITLDKFMTAIQARKKAEDDADAQWRILYN